MYYLPKVRKRLEQTPGCPIKSGIDFDALRIGRRTPSPANTLSFYTFIPYEKGYKAISHCLNFDSRKKNCVMELLKYAMKHNYF